MMKAVIDTNVLLVANRQHSDVAEECILACTDRLQELKERGQAVIDDSFYIISEYQRKMVANRGKGMGMAFLKWLLQNKANPSHVEQIRITEIDTDHFQEFPIPELEPEFDPSDRKFVAVANAHPDKPPIWQATDCKWLDWWSRLHEHGIRVEFLCSKDVVRFYHNKFPNQEIPALP